MSLNQMANAVRFLAVDMVSKAKSGHPGAPLGMADILTVLWSKFLRIDPSTPKWQNRDRFVLSNGHASAALYALLYLTGYKDATIDEIKNFRQWGSKTAGHPEYGFLEGIEFTTGPLGQGIAGAVGMALAERMANARFGNLVSHKTYVMVGDGCLMEGISEEAISLAGHLKLSNLIVMWDNNHITIDGDTKLATSVDMRARFIANGWRVLSADGNDFDAIEKVLMDAQVSDKPVFIDFKTVIGFGSPKAGTSAVHGAPLSDEEVKETRQKLEWNYGPFEVPENILGEWRAAGERCAAERRAWEDEVRMSVQQTEFDRFFKREFQGDWEKVIRAYKEKVLADKPEIATRKASQNALEVLAKLVPGLVGGSADLTGSNLTNTSVSKPIVAGDYSGNYINYGIREHVMGAMMNGMGVYGGFIPYGGTFFNFVDYMKPAVRLASLMGVQEIYVLTHDSIGLGEDGPTHQPIEQLAALRAMPNILMFRPCDPIEVMEAYEVALKADDRPTAIALSRQNVPTLRTDATENLSAGGAYVLFPEDNKRQATIIATGTEVQVAVEAKRQLCVMGVDVAVVSMPCWELFEQQDKKYQEIILGNAPRVAIEAASPMGWHRWVGDKGAIIAINTFGASAPAKTVYEKFGLSVQNVVETILNLIEQKKG